MKTLVEASKFLFFSNCILQRVVDIQEQSQVLDQQETINAMVKMIAPPEKVDVATQTVIVAMTPSSPALPSSEDFEFEEESHAESMEEGEVESSPEVVAEQEEEGVEDPLRDLWASHMEEGEVESSPEVVAEQEEEGVEDPLRDLWASPETPVRSPLYTTPQPIPTMIRPRRASERRMSFKGLNNIKKAVFNGEDWFFE